VHPPFLKEGGGGFFLPAVPSLRKGRLKENLEKGENGEGIYKKGNGRGILQKGCG